MTRGALQGTSSAMQLLCAAVLKYDAAIPERRFDLSFAIRCVSAIAGKFLSLMIGHHLLTSPLLRDSRSRLFNLPLGCFDDIGPHGYFIV